jgi:hypothetical protein
MATIAAHFADMPVPCSLVNFRPHGAEVIRRRTLMIVEQTDRAPLAVAGGKTAKRVFDAPRCRKPREKAPFPLFQRLQLGEYAFASWTMSLLVERSIARRQLRRSCSRSSAVIVGIFSMILSHMDRLVHRPVPYERKHGDG